MTYLSMWYHRNFFIKHFLTHWNWSFVLWCMFFITADVKKMPLGKISKSQIAKGFEVLEKIADALKNNRNYLLQQLSSDFYTLIPHNFGRQRPPPISDNEFLQKKMDLLTVSANERKTKYVKSLKLSCFWYSLLWIGQRMHMNFHRDHRATALHFWWFISLHPSPLLPIWMTLWQFRSLYMDQVINLLWEVTLIKQLEDVSCRESWLQINSHDKL